MKHEVERAVRELPTIVRAHVLDEGAADPGFWPYFAPLALSADPRSAVDEAMLRVAVNVTDPARFRETRGRWPVLRARFSEALRQVGEAARRQAIPAPHEPGYLMDLSELRGLGMAPLIDALARAYAEVVGRRTGQLGDMGQDWITSLTTAITSLAPSALQLYQQRLALKQQAAAQKLATQQAALAFPAAAAPPPPPPPPMAPPVIVGPARERAWYEELTLPVLAVGAAVLAGGGYMVYRATRR